MHAVAASQQLDATVYAPAKASIISDGVNRINQSGRLRMLTQRIAAASCALSSNVAIEESQERLKEAGQEFDQIIKALQFGDEHLQIVGEETRKLTIANIEKLSTEWAPTRQAIDAVLENGHEVEEMRVILDSNMPLLELTKNLSSGIANQYAHPFEITHADTMMLEIAARQRMFTQKMTKDSCRIWTDYNSQEAKDDLNKTMELFEVSLLALRDGYPDVGIKAAPTSQIADELDTILASWEAIKTKQLSLVNGDEIDDSAKYEIFNGLNLELAGLDNLVHNYVAYAERNH